LAELEVLKYLLSFPYWHYCPFPDLSFNSLWQVAAIESLSVCFLGWNIWEISTWNIEILYENFGLGRVNAQWSGLYCYWRGFLFPFTRLNFKEKITFFWYSMKIWKKIFVYIKLFEVFIPLLFLSVNIVPNFCPEVNTYKFRVGKFKTQMAVWWLDWI